MNVYKFLSICLAIALAIAVTFFVVQSKKTTDVEAQLEQETSKNIVLTKDSNTLYDTQAQQVQNLQANLDAVKLENSDLAKQIQDKDKQVVALTQLTVSLKDQLFKINSAKQTVQDQNGNVVDFHLVPEECEKLSERVDFEQTQDNMHVKGYTTTNPAFAQLQLNYVNPFQVNVIVVETKTNQFEAYADVNPQLNLNAMKVQFQPLEHHWYEKLSIGTSIAAGRSNALASVSPKYDVGAFSVGPEVYFLFNTSTGYSTLYGASIAWHPWSN